MTDIVIYSRFHSCLRREFTLLMLVPGDMSRALMLAEGILAISARSRFTTQKTSVAIERSMRDCGHIRARITIVHTQKLGSKEKTI